MDECQTLLGGYPMYIFKTVLIYRSIEFTSHLCVDILYPNISECRCVMFSHWKMSSHWAGCNIVPNSNYGAQQYMSFKLSALSNICQSAWAFKHICDVRCRARDDGFNFIFFSCMRMVKRVCLVCTDCGRQFKWVRPIIPATTTTHMPYIPGRMHVTTITIPSAFWPDFIGAIGVYLSWSLSFTHFIND